MQQAEAVEQRWRPPAFWLIVAALTAFVAFGTNLLEINYSNISHDRAGTWGISYVFENQTNQVMVVTSVEAGSAAAARGIRPGDRLVSNYHNGPGNVPLVGEKIRLIRLTPPPSKDFTLVATRADPAPMAVPDPINRAIDDSVRVLMLLGGIVILWRGWNRRSSFLLGTALMGMTTFPTGWVEMSRGAYHFWYVASSTMGGSISSYILLGFAMAYIREMGVSVPRWLKVAMLIGLSDLLLTWLFFTVIPDLTPAWLLSPLVTAIHNFSGPIAFTLSLLTLMYGWRHGTVQSRHRTALLVLAVGMLVIGNMLFSFNNQLVQSQANPSFITNTSSATRAIGIMLFTYAILRHRVIDIGFTVNRTLVYGSVSLILLATFGLLEWGLHHLLEIEGKESSPLIDAGLAVSIFLAFHPVRDFVEHYVERWFFSSWQQAEMQLKRFVTSAGHFNSAQVLCEAFVRELSHYTEGAEAALYMGQSDGAYQLTAGSLSGADEQYEDNTAFALMRSEREPIELLHGEVALPGALALPMLDQGVLIGFALLAGKPDGSHFRPDELENLEWAAHQVGLDLQALHARELEKENAELRRAVTSVSEERDRLLDRLSLQT
ncbi:GAF domain-containing protein [Tsuneonella mangrovi]|uniref:GAF domain-containing protein n=1 Tax=Tsuneonella mangrovi TaxID=1982042 RepID=UPI000BA1F445|nr:GAF domain-containing protein [Tsuneonella mangrovi]